MGFLRKLKKAQRRQFSKVRLPFQHRSMGVTMFMGNREWLGKNKERKHE